MNQPSLNSVFSKPTMRRRYEVWFLRLGLADGSGAWWFRYLVLNPGRTGGGGCAGHASGMPVQVWATWFPRDGEPRSFIQGFPLPGLSLSGRGASPFQLAVANNRIGEDSCVGRVEVEGHQVSWDLSYRSTFGTAITNVGWIGFSRSPHSDAVFSGQITLDGRTFRGEPLGYGLQGHNCGFRYRNLWNWTHCVFPSCADGGLTTFEALEYEIPLGLRFRRAILWHKGHKYTFKKIQEIRRDRLHLQWIFRCARSDDGSELVAVVDGSGPSVHRLPYLKTDCSATFEVANNSFSRATLYFSRPGYPVKEIKTEGGAALEMVGQ